MHALMFLWLAALNLFYCLSAAGAAEGYRDCALNMQSSKRDIRLLSESAFRTSVQVEQPGRGCLSVLGQL
jgi:hypothetical protein